MKNIAYTYILIFLLISCTKEKEKEVEDGIFSEMHVDISYLNSKREDLLNPDTEGYFPIENMKLYYVSNGIKTEVYNGLMAYPRNIKLIEETEPFILRIFTSAEGKIINENDSIKTGKSINILEVNENVSDTITTEWIYYKNSASISITKFWFNGSLYSRTVNDALVTCIKE